MAEHSDVVAAMVPVVASVAGALLMVFLCAKKPKKRDTMLAETKEDFGKWRARERRAVTLGTNQDLFNHALSALFVLLVQHLAACCCEVGKR
jgi:hypothetical protein